MPPITYSRSDLLVIMLNDAGISVDEMSSWHANEDGSLTVHLLVDAATIPAPEPATTGVG